MMLEPAGRIFSKPNKRPVFSPLRSLQPIFLLFVLALGVLLLISGCGFQPASSEEQPVEPRVAEREDVETGYSLLGRFSVVNPEMSIYSLEISESGEQILFSSEARSISLLDEEGALLWEVDFEETPYCARLSSDGRVAVVGTEKGEIHYLLSGGRALWEQELEGAFRLLSLSPGGEYIAASVEKPEGENENGEDGEEKQHTLYLLDRWGRKLWHEDTGPLKKLFFSSQGELYVQEKQDGEEGSSRLLAYDVASGEKHSWEKTVSLASFSEDGTFAAFLGSDKDSQGLEELSFYRLREGKEPQRLWTRSLEVEASWLELTEEGGKVIAYSEFSGGFDNLFAFGKQGNFLWSTRIPGGALLKTSPSGDKIVASSWQEYSEDFSKVLVLDTSGNVLQEFEMATRIEKIALSGWGNILALASTDGNIFVLDVSHADSEREVLLAEEVEKELNYNPVSFELPENYLYITLYLYDEQAEELVPVNRQIGRTSGVLQAAIDELVRGPRRVTGLYRTIPKDASIAVNLDNGKAFLDLPKELDQLSGSSQLQGIVDSLVLTASQFSSVNGVRFMVEGEEVEALGKELMLEETFSPERPLNERPILFYPHRSQKSFFLLPASLDASYEDPPQTPKQFVELLLEKSEAYFPQLPGVEDVRVRRDEIIVDWDASVKDLFPEEGEPNDKARAKLFSDMFLLTLAANFPPDRVVFQVEGQQWEPPEKYPSFERSLEQPFYLNPE